LTWRTKETTVLYARPDARSPRVGKVIAGSEVVAVTGEVHVIPGRFTVKKAIESPKPEESFKPGDVIWLYTYRSGGVFKIWFDGKMYSADLPFGMSFQRPAKTTRLPRVVEFGEMEDPNMTWWIKFKSEKGLVGWTTQEENFDHPGCG
jgi:hypothetical protein